MNETRLILDEVLAERAKQDEMWGGPDHDDEHSVLDWHCFIADRSLEAERAVVPVICRRKLLAIAALAVAAIEAHDRAQEKKET